MICGMEKTVKGYGFFYIFVWQLARIDLPLHCCLKGYDMKRICFLLLATLIAHAASAQVKDTLRVLAIGNSFSEDAVEQYLWELGKEAGVHFIIGNAYRGGWSLIGHWNDARSKAVDTEYRKVTDGKRVNRGKYKLREIITDEPWDVITLQQVSQDAGRPESYEPGLSLMIGYVTALAVDSVRLGFHQTWAYAQDSEHKGFANYNYNQYNMYSSITAAVDKAMHQHRYDLTFYVPSGTAIQNARTTYLGDNMNRDGYHLDLKFGRYTAACTWLETLTGISPVGLRYKPEGVDEAAAHACQVAAHAAVQNPFEVTKLSTEGFNARSAAPADIGAYRERNDLARIILAERNDPG